MAKPSMRRQIYKAGIICLSGNLKTVYSKELEKTEWQAVFNLPLLHVKLRTDKRVLA